MGSPELVSVVIPTRNGEDTLPAVLAGLVSQKAPFPIELVAVDSDSDDRTREILERYGVRVHRIEAADFDHGGARNLGIAIAEGDPIVLLTQDAVPATPHLVERLVEAFEDPRVAGAYGRQVPRSDCDVVTRRNLEAGLAGRSEPSLSRRGETPLVEMEPMARLELCAFDNVCSAVRRSVWKEIPFPRTAFGEDLGWGRRVIEEGWSIAYQADASVVHSHRRSIRYEYERTRICHQRLYELFGLALVPDRGAVWRGVIANLRHDLPWVWREAPSGAERFRQLARAIGLSVVGPLAQYHGLNDARLASSASVRTPVDREREKIR